MIEGTPTPECQVAENDVILKKLKQQAREAIQFDYYRSTMSQLMLAGEVNGADISKRRSMVRQLFGCFFSYAGVVDPRSSKSSCYDEGEDCVDFGERFTRQGPVLKAVPKLWNPRNDDNIIIPEDNVTFELLEDDVENYGTSLQGIYVWSLLKRMEANARTYGKGYAGVLHPKLWAEWPRTMSLK
ncbi:hypothetical protein QR680_015040 [Steinernema hermaphroditum]|uniref:Uncharacterized protein n=1 Tax=Steinernema hermaphroditum TaxID=289476 RepID=A0AA39ID35_9BILA|nr:hypothetical protein QR680_015040 [Steinernema hermaphroditum]